MKQTKPYSARNNTHGHKAALQKSGYGFRSLTRKPEVTVVGVGGGGVWDIGGLLREHILFPVTPDNK